MLNVKELLSAIQKTEGWKNTSVKHEYVFYSDLLAELMFVCRDEWSIGSVPVTHSGEGIFSHESVDLGLFYQGCIIYHSKQGSRIPNVRWPIKRWFNMHQDILRGVVSLLKMSCVNSIHGATISAEIWHLVWRPWPWMCWSFWSFFLFHLACPPLRVWQNISVHRKTQSGDKRIPRKNILSMCCELSQKTSKGRQIIKSDSSLWIDN